MKGSENVVELFDVDFSDSRYLEHQESQESFQNAIHNNLRLINQVQSTVTNTIDSNAVSLNGRSLAQIVTTVTNTIDSSTVSTLEYMHQMGYEDDPYKFYDALGPFDIPIFEGIRQEVNDMRKMGNSSVITNSLDEEGLHQNADLLSLGFDIESYYNGAPLNGMAVFDDNRVFEFHSLEELLIECKTSNTNYSYRLAFEVDQHFPFLSCPCCGRIKPYYADVFVNQEPYDLCEECQKMQNEINSGGIV